MKDQEKVYKNLSISGESLIDLIQHLPNSAHLKDIKTGQYILSNKNNAKIYDFEDENKIIGLIVDDIENQDYVNVVHQLDYQVIQQNSCVNDHCRLVHNRNGILRLQNMLKIPITGFDNNQ